MAVTAKAAVRSARPCTLMRSFTAWAVSMPSGPKLKVGVPPRVKLAASCQLSRPAGRPVMTQAAGHLQGRRHQRVAGRRLATSPLSVAAAGHPAQRHLVPSPRLKARGGPDAWGH